MHRLCGSVALAVLAAWVLAQTPPPAENAFSDRVASAVLNDLRDGLEGHDQSLLLSAFDRNKMEGYGAFADQIQAFFERYDSFRVHYRIAQTMVEGARGIVLVDCEMEETPHDSNIPPRRKSAQMRFELERIAKGWKIVDFSPRDFFS